MTERLTNPCRNCCESFNGERYSWLPICEHCKERITYEKCLKTAEEQGRLVVLPCKIGDMVYVIAPNHRLCEAKHDCDEYDYENYFPSWCENYCPYGYKGVGVIKDIVSHIEIRDNGICYCTTNCGYLYDDKVFLTREEAKKALKEMGEKQDE